MACCAFIAGMFGLGFAAWGRLSGKASPSAVAWRLERPEQDE